MSAADRTGASTRTELFGHCVAGTLRDARKVGLGLLDVRSGERRSLAEANTRQWMSGVPALSETESLFALPGVNEDDK